MSMKQMAKLKALREAEAAAKNPPETTQSLPTVADAEEDEDDDECEMPVSAPSFAMLAEDSSESEEQDSQEEDTEQPILPASQTSTASATAGTSASARRRRNKKLAAAADEIPEVADVDSDDALLGAAAAQVAAETVPDGADLAEDGSCSRQVSIRRVDFSLEAERRRAAGRGGAPDPAARTRERRAPGRPQAVQARGRGEGLTVHHRRLFLVTPTADEPWPRPDDFAAMTQAWDELDGSAVFDIQDTHASTKSLERLRDCLRTMDPEQLHIFLRQNLFCVDGLLTLADYYHGRGEHEQAFQMLRRAVYTVECGFTNGFSPFEANGNGFAPQRPRCRVLLPDSNGEGDTWPGWTWLRALFMYAKGVADQGMHRTSLEVCKLILASTLPRDPTHVLQACDYLALRARHYDAVAQLSSLTVQQYVLQDEAEDGDAVWHLNMALPNFAYSLALAGLLKASEPLPASVLNEVSIDDVVPIFGTISDAPTEAPTGPAVAAQLMRALLLFPLALRPLLDEAGASLSSAPPGSSSSDSWAELLAKRPFGDAAEYLHREHAVALGNSCAFYAKRCGPLWRAELPLRWLHSCAARLASMHDSTVFAEELTVARARWAKCRLPLELALRKDYVELKPTEGSAENPSPPVILERAMQARLHPPHQGRAFGEGGHWGEGGEGGVDAIVPNVSLHSPPLLIFLQSLLPWCELDRSGVRVQPLSWTGLVRTFGSDARGWSLGFGKGVWELAVFIKELTTEVSQEAIKWFRGTA